MSEIISSKDNAKVKEAWKAKDGKGDYFLIEGFHLLEMALQAKAVKAIFALREYPSSVPTYMVTPEIIAKLSSTLHPEGIVALCAKKKVSSFSSSRLLYLDHVNDPGNVGTLLRTALSFGFHDVFLSKGTAEVYASKVLLASQGAIFFLNILSSSKGAEEDMAFLKEQGYEIVSTTLQNAKTPEEIPPFAKLALVLGNEARGVLPEVLASSSFSIKIPMGGIDSLNVGVAGGILMYLLKEKTPLTK